MPDSPPQPRWQRGLWIDHRRPYRRGWNELGIILNILGALPLVIFGCLMLVTGVALLQTQHRDACGVLGVGALLTLMGVWGFALAIQLIRRQMRANSGPSEG